MAASSSSSSPQGRFRSALAPLRNQIRFPQTPSCLPSQTAVSRRKVEGGRLAPFADVSRLTESYRPKTGGGGASLSPMQSFSGTSGTST